MSHFESQDISNIKNISTIIIDCPISPSLSKMFFIIDSVCFTLNAN